MHQNIFEGLHVMINDVPGSKLRFYGINLTLFPKLFARWKCRSATRSAEVKREVSSLQFECAARQSLLQGVEDDYQIDAAKSHLAPQLQLLPSPYNYYGRTGNREI